MRTYLTWTLAGLCLVLLPSVACSPTQPDPLPTNTATAGCNVTGSNNQVNCGGGQQQVTQPPPTTLPAGGGTGDNVVAGFAIFCYGFGTQPGQEEPNHDKCELPHGYPNIAVTASPKNKAGQDIPQPGDKTDPKVIDWTITPAPAGCATLNVQADNRFNATVVPAEARVDCSFTLVSTFKDPANSVEQPYHVATKSGSVKQ